MAISNLTNGLVYIVNYVYARRPGSTTVNHTITINGSVIKTYQNSVGSDSAWTNDSFTFTASGTTASMVFTSGTTSGTDQTLVFDNINVSLLNAAGAINLVYYPTTSPTTVINASGITIPPAQWNHLAIVRNGTTVSSYLNGTLYGTANTSFTASLDSGPGIANTLVVGSAGGTSQQNIAGFIDEVRVTMGVARYTTNFALPTAPYPNGGSKSLFGWSTTTNAGVAIGNSQTNNITPIPFSASTIAVSNAY